MSSEDRSTKQPAGTEANIFSAADLRRRMVEREMAKAAEELRHMKEQEEKQKAVMEEFHQPPARTPEQLIQLIMQLVTRAAEAGHTEVQVYPFPNDLCTDRGRRINNSLPDWEKTLEGRPKLGYEFWRDHLRPLGFGFKAEVLEYPGECPATSASFLAGSRRTRRDRARERVGGHSTGYK